MGAAKTAAFANLPSAKRKVLDVFLKVMEKKEYGEREWETEEKRVIQRLLEHKLGSEHIAIRPGASGSKFVYVESWKAIELANSIFGFDGWSSQIVDITPDFIEEVAGGKFRVGVTAVVKVMLKDGTFHEDVGYGICEDKRKGTAIENAKKEAVSDARKRALRVFGNALGNCVYDKEHIKKVKGKVKGAATSTVSYDKLRAGTMTNGIANAQQNEYVATNTDDIDPDGVALPQSPDGNGEEFQYQQGDVTDTMQYNNQYNQTNQNLPVHSTRGHEQNTNVNYATGMTRQNTWQSN